MDTDTLIIGGGLAGLRLADMLHAQGRSFLLLEARDRFGGRVLSEAAGGARFDLGPSWFWPGQPRIAALIERLGLTSFDQATQGAAVFEDGHGRIQHGRGYASMAGSWRLAGGLAGLATALTQASPTERLRLSSQVVALGRRADGVEATLANGEAMLARRVVIAAPPRVAAARIAFSPALPADAMEAMRELPTWMAGQAKAVALYEEPFWRTAGLSGDAMSQYGPMVEIHDASPASSGPFALFGFIGVPPAARADQQALRAQVIAQFGRLFGARAAQPVALLLKDWAFEAYTATEDDHTPLRAHPRYGLPAAMNGLWDDALLFGGAEVATEFGGYMEGAFAAAESAAARLAELG